MTQGATRYAMALLLGAVLVPFGFSENGAMYGEPQPPLVRADFNILAPHDSIGLFLLVGQSSMKGRGAVDMEPKTNKRILFFHPTEEAWFVARDPLHATGTPEKLDPRDNAGTGPELSFAKDIVGKGPDAGIGLIPAARGGAAMNLYNEGRKLYTRSLDMTQEAIDQAEDGKANVRAILWLQGESDSLRRETVDAYEEKLLSLVDRYRRDFNDSELPFLACTIGSFIHDDEVKRKRFPFTREINEILMALPNRAKHGLRDARDLKGHIGDHVHYNTESQVEIGKRFAEAYLNVLKQKRDSEKSK